MSAKPAASNRPLSPFMIGPYYRPQITSMLSITHRLTGMALAAGTLFLAIWVLCVASGPAAYARWQWIAGGIGGRIVTVAFTWALLFHLCNGIRHLAWDTGRGFSLPAVYRSGYLVITGSILLTVAVWAVALFC